MARKGITVGVEITGEAKGFKKAAEDAKKASANMKGKMHKDATGISAVFQKMGGVVGRVARDVVNAFKLIMANPVALALGAIVATLGALVGAFKSTDRGGTEFAARIEQVKAGLDVFRQRLVTVGDAVRNVFKGEWKEAGEKMKEAFSGIGKQIKEATDAAYAYTKAMDVLTDSEQNYISVSAENRNKIARLEFTAQDRTKSVGERRRALQDAIATGEEEVKQQRAFARQRLELEAGYLAEKNGLRAEDVIAFTKMTDAEQANVTASLQTLRNNNEKKLVEIENLYANWMNLDTKFYEENKRNMSRLSGFELQEIKKREDALKALKKVYEDVYRVQTGLSVIPSAPAKTTKGSLVDASRQNQGEIQANEISSALQYQIGIVNDLETAFESLFANTGRGFAGMAEAFGNALKQMAAQLAAKAAIFGILNLLTGGTGALAGVAKGMIGGRSLGQFMGVTPFASGGLVSGPTFAKVGEYAGARSNPEVIAPLDKLKTIMGPQTITVKGKIAGRDIYLSNDRYGRMLNKTT